MSIEREQDGALPLPGVPAPAPAADETAAKATEDEARFEAVKRRVKDADPDTLNWAEKLARNAALEEERRKNSQAETSLNDAAEATAPKARPSRSKKAKEPTASATITDDQAPTQKPAKSRKTKVPVAGQDRSEGIDAPPAPTAPARRARRKAPSNTTSQEQSASPAAQPVPRRDIPPITNEAIAFLNDPDAKAADLFKLAPDSQAFVQYHITNMQRLEADSKLAHAHLLATATKLSPRFEQAADALVRKPGRDRSVIADVQDKKMEPAQAAVTSAKGTDAYYGPQQAAVTVSLAKQASRNDKERVAEPLQENTIEPTVAVENARQPVQDTQHPSQRAQDAAIPSAQQSGRTGQKLLRGMGSVYQAAASWLQRTAQEIPPAAESAPAVSPAQPTVPVVDRSAVVPDEVTRRFLKVDRDYYFLDRTPAFSDRGNKLATRGEHPEVVRSLVDIAIARGWDNITVKGTESFRRAAWMEAAQSGLKVAGYHPTALDLADLANRPGKNIVEKGAAKERAHPAPESAHRPEATEAMATQAAGSKADQGHSSSALEKDPDLVAKARSFDKDKPSFVVKKHPELAPAYGVIDAAKKFAESNLPDAAKEEFIGLARRYVMNKIISGEAVVGPKVFMAAAKSRDGVYATQSANRELPDSGTKIKSREIAPEK